VKHLIALCVGTALALTACASAEPAASTTNSPPQEAPVTTDTDGPIPVIVDYSPTVSDVGGFLYLLSHPGVEVIAVSLPETGMAGCDADASVADLEAKGVSLINGPLDRAWGQRTACFADPDGHLWEIAQHLD
jgi:catechol 2,3-dioxygenase-like lactoylglutathione lyase family enzyme